MHKQQKRARTLYSSLSQTAYEFDSFIVNLEELVADISSRNP